MSQDNRAETMAVKLDAYARRAGLQSDALLNAYELAVERRMAVLRDVFHPDMLHPARNVLILLEDAEIRDPDVLLAAALTETEYPALSFEPEAVMARFGPRAAELLAGVPVPRVARDALAEQLVTAEHDVAIIAVADRLDHARHLHFRDQAVWRPFHAQIRAVYLPVAERVEARMAQRLARWASSFERRFLS
ncbi:MAG TPA: hypothetical protein VF021_07710 [Longimicrobiales bacterium]